MQRKKNACVQYVLADRSRTTVAGIEQPAPVSALFHSCGAMLRVEVTSSEGVLFQKSTNSEIQVTVPARCIFVPNLLVRVCPCPDILFFLSAPAASRLKAHQSKPQHALDVLGMCTRARARIVPSDIARAIKTLYVTIDHEYNQMCRWVHNYYTRTDRRSILHIRPSCSPCLYPL